MGNNSGPGARRPELEPLSRATLGVRTGSKQTPPQTQWGDGGSRCSDCTAEQEEEMSYQTRAGKQSAGSFHSLAREGWSRGERRGGLKESKRPLPSSSSSESQ